MKPTVNRRMTRRVATDLHKLEARYVQAKRTQLDRRTRNWALLAFAIGIIAMAIINWLVR
jgi:hypothetical protein